MAVAVGLRCLTRMACAPPIHDFSTGFANRAPSSAIWMMARRRQSEEDNCWVKQTAYSVWRQTVRSVDGTTLWIKSQPFFRGRFDSVTDMEFPGDQWPMACTRRSRGLRRWISPHLIFSFGCTTLWISRFTTTHAGWRAAFLRVPLRKGF